MRDDPPFLSFLELGLILHVRHEQKVAASQSSVKSERPQRCSRMGDFLVGVAVRWLWYVMLHKWPTVA